jgi:hypothetical protein
LRRQLATAHADVGGHVATVVTVPFVDFVAPDADCGISVCAAIATAAPPSSQMVR